MSLLFAVIQGQFSNIVCYHNVSNREQKADQQPKYAAAENNLSLIEPT